MAKSEDGHYELVLGNRQLVSGFFVLVILFAIFLTLGYILGRNSVVVNEQGVVMAENESSAQATEPLESASSGKPSPADSQPEAVAPEPAPVSSPPVAAAPERLASANVETAKPMATSPAAAAEPAPTRTQEILDGKVRVITPRNGDMFVQVAAVSRPEAELMGEQLQKRGYRAFISEVPGRDLFRVLVGPFQTSQKMGEVKKKLESEGINSIIQKY